MTREQLVKMLDAVADFVWDPKETAVFTGKSLRDIVLHLRNEIEMSGADPSDIVDTWVENAPTFKKVLLTSARLDHVTVRVEGKQALVVREKNAAAATAKCAKGPGAYDHPRMVKA